MKVVIFTSLISNVVGLTIGFLVNRLKYYYKNDKIQSIALKNLLSSNLVNLYYVYKEIGRCPVFVKKTWYNMYESYVSLGGNSFIKDDIKPKWDAIETYEE